MNKLKDLIKKILCIKLYFNYFLNLIWFKIIFRDISLVFNKDNFLQQITRIKLKILEIGPFDRPYFHGNNVKYFDILDKEALQTRAKSLPDRNYKNVPFIDYVSPNGDLSIVKDKFNIFFSSHVIEHQPDLIKHLRDVSDRLVDGGSYCCIIPDKRFCFDSLHQESSVSEIIVANLEKRTHPILRSVIEHRCFTVHDNIVKKFYRLSKFDEITLEDKLCHAIEEYNENDYVDVHAWYFTPESFVRILKLLYVLSYTDLVVESISPTKPFDIDFCVKLTKKSFF